MIKPLGNINYPLTRKDKGPDQKKTRKDEGENREDKKRRRSGAITCFGFIENQHVLGSTPFLISSILVPKFSQNEVSVIGP